MKIGSLWKAVMDLIVPPVAGFRTKTFRHKVEKTKEQQEYLMIQAAKKRVKRRMRNVRNERKGAYTNGINV